ncbi:anti-sigma factor family protein [Geodermatophilus normandii]|uniref:Zf-HC2 domain-containing protein n=1 Tax=Geodermatophilus normandii TaxID=1137989 RepID=A0A6P0GGQ1_9ACTN|nr:zf-HC2 domain-containing protein [Geodermatophilus normandii]NEM06458.1 zf-HC2 domain-containing protein [Geodermatophilus normandii]
MSLPESHLAQEAIAALVDGELASGPAARAARHLAGCLECRMLVQAQREAKDALHAASDVAVPGDLLSRLCAIPFTADVPGGGGLGTVTAGPGQLTVSGSSGRWTVALDDPPARPSSPHQARWLRRSVAGTLAGLGLGVAVLAVNLPEPGETPTGVPASVAGPSAPDERTEVVPPVVRTLAGQPPAAGATP